MLFVSVVFIFEQNYFLYLYREFLTVVDQLMVLSFTGTTGCKLNNFADESACLMPDNVWN
jgi:hypothetical protein